MAYDTFQHLSACLRRSATQSQRPSPTDFQLPTIAHHPGDSRSWKEKSKGKWGGDGGRAWATAKRKTIFTLTRMLVASFRCFRCFSLYFFVLDILLPLPQLSTDSHLAIHQNASQTDDSTGHFLGPRDKQTRKFKEDDLDILASG